jgi:hypothetical protein
MRKNDTAGHVGVVTRTTDNTALFFLILIEAVVLLFGVDVEVGVPAVFILREFGLPTLIEGGGDDAKFQVSLCRDIQPATERKMPVLMLGANAKVIQGKYGRQIKNGASVFVCLHPIHYIFGRKHLFSK